MKLVDNNICVQCNEIENAEHIITKCSKHTNIRNKYPVLSNNNYINIQNNNNYQIISNYLDEIDYKL